MNCAWIRRAPQESWNTQAFKYGIVGMVMGVALLLQAASVWPALTHRTSGTSRGSE